MVRPNPLVHVHGEVDDLARTHLRNEDIRIGRRDHAIAVEELGLAADWEKFDILGIDVRVIVQLCRVCLVLIYPFLAGTLSTLRARFTVL